MPEATINRVAYSPGEFAKMFGKSQTWGYREIYRGNVNAITEHGRILIPAKEVERILESAGIYNGREKPKAAEVRIKKMTLEQKNIWQRFLEMRREPSALPARAPCASNFPGSKRGGNSRVTVRERLAKSWSAKKHPPRA